MSKINDIIISNFKFFSSEEKIQLGGKHLLLYGENGSGKSSLYWGLYTLLGASFQSPYDATKCFIPFTQHEDSLVNINAPVLTDAASNIKHCQSYIQIIDDKSKVYNVSLLDTSICGDTGAQESLKASDFINYKALFKFQNFGENEINDLGNIFENSILPYITFAPFTIKGKNLTNAWQMWSEYKDGPGHTTNYKGKQILVYKNSAAYRDFLNFEAHFNAEFEKLIDFINTNAKVQFTKLGYDMDFQLVYIRPSHIKKDIKYDSSTFKIELKITKYNGVNVNIKKPHVFLNEAKLSALATAIKLSILDYRISSTVAPDCLKILVLDDIMISMDMCNREPLLNLLFNEYSNKYQILFLTHDKSLYNFVDHKIRQEHQNDKWVRKEMFIGEDDATKYETPVIINGECDLFTKAQKYFQAKDYVASALFVRKSFEQKINELLPKELIQKPDGSFVDLQTLWAKLITYYSNNGNAIDNDTVKLFEDSKLLVLNPSAHFQRLSNPIYKNELVKAFDLYKKISLLQKIEKELVIEAGKMFTFDYNGYYCEFTLLKDLIIIEGEHLVSVMPKCSNIKWKYQGIEYYNFDTKTADPSNPLKTSTPKFNKFIEGITKLPINVTEEIFMEHCKIESILLKDYFPNVKISELKKSTLIP